jgi:hypothetical protein
MRYQILVTISLQDGSPGSYSMTTNVLDYATREDAELAYKRIFDGYPQSAHYAVAVKLY